MKLHLGCGNIKLEGFVNIDVVASPAVDRVMDVRHLEYPDNSVDVMYAAHMLEHFRKTEVRSILREWKRVLKPGGTVIIIVPNFDRFVVWYLLHFGRLTKNFTFDVVGGNSHANEQEHIEDYHKMLFNPRSFRELAKEIGFSSIEKMRDVSIIEKRKLHWSSMGFKLTK